MNEPDDYLWDRKGRDPEVERLEKLLSPLAHDSARHRVPEAPKVPEPANRPMRVLVLGALVAAAAVAMFTFQPGPRPTEVGVSPTVDDGGDIDVSPELDAAIAGDPTDFVVEAVDGLPSCNGVPSGEDADLQVGGWLETDAVSRARLTLPEIGVLDVDPGTRLRLLRSDESEHRMELAEGRISAVVVAPPRFFVVQTPTVTAVDMGCAYTLEVTPEGDSVLDVTSGWVWLEQPDRTSMVPAGARAIARKGSAGPGTPWFRDADPAWSEALAEVDAGKGNLAAVLAGARPRDSLSLVHLLPRVDPDERAAVWTRLAELAPVDPALRAAALAGDHDALLAVLEETRAIW